MISVEDVSKNHGRSPVLCGVRLAVKRGEVAGIIGPSGSGKSTLLRCINGLDSFESGRIQVGNIVLVAGMTAPKSSEVLRALRRTVGMVFQQFHLFPHMTALENVMAGPRYVLHQSRDKAEQEARARLCQVGLADKCHARPAELSGGQQQRVAIARSLAVRPQAILFDEPTSALDPRMAAEVFNVMGELARAGQTMIVVTHSMSFARQFAHQINVMHEGRIVESGPPDQIFGGPREGATKAFLSEVSRN
jgi:ABC-type polar amino acid transport system ATPase subunit